MPTPPAFRVVTYEANRYSNRSTNRGFIFPIRRQPKTFTEIAELTDSHDLSPTWLTDLISAIA